MKYKCAWREDRPQQGSRTTTTAMSCQRCALSNVSCELPARKHKSPSDERLNRDDRRRKEDDRIATLEQSVDALQNMIAQMKPGREADSTRSTSISSGSSQDCAITEAMGRRLFQFCCASLFEFWRVIRVPREMTYDDVLRERPMLLEAMIAIAALVACEPEAEYLLKRARSRVVNAHVDDGVRSVELVQCFMVLSIWTDQFDRSTVLRNTTFWNLAMQNACDIEGEPETFACLWDAYEFDRCRVCLYLGSNTAKLCQLPQEQHHPISNWSAVLSASVERLLQGNSFEKTLGYMARLVETGEAATKRPLTTAAYDQVIRRLREILAHGESQSGILFQMSFNVLEFSLLEFWITSNIDAALGEQHDQFVARATRAIEKLLLDQYSVLDQLVQSPLNKNLPASLLVRPLICLAILGRICRLLRIPHTFESAILEVRHRLELLCLASHFAALMLGKLGPLQEWFETPSSVESTNFEILTSPPTVMTRPTAFHTLQNPERGTGDTSFVIKPFEQDAGHVYGSRDGDLLSFNASLQVNPNALTTLATTIQPPVFPILFGRTMQEEQAVLDWSMFGVDWCSNDALQA